MRERRIRESVLPLRKFNRNEILIIDLRSAKLERPNIIRVFAT